MILQALAAVFGFVAPFIPELFHFFQRRQDAKLELEMFKLRAEHAGKEHLWRMEETSARADIEEAKVLHRPQHSYGVQLLDAARGMNLPQWVFVPVLWLYAIVDALSVAVRPMLAYGAYGFYVAYKWARMTLLMNAGDTNAQAIALTWGPEDWALLTLICSYWFGHRAAKGAFGGKAL